MSVGDGKMPDYNAVSKISSNEKVQSGWERVQWVGHNRPGFDSQILYGILSPIRGDPLSKKTGVSPICTTRCGPKPRGVVVIRDRHDQVLLYCNGGRGKLFLM